METESVVTVAFCARCGKENAIVGGDVTWSVLCIDCYDTELALERSTITTHEGRIESFRKRREHKKYLREEL